MTTKEQTIQEVEQVPKPLLERILEVGRSLKSKAQENHTASSPSFFDLSRRAQGGLPAPCRILTRK